MQVSNGAEGTQQASQPNWKVLWLLAAFIAFWLVLVSLFLEYQSRKGIITNEETIGGILGAD